MKSKDFSANENLLHSSFLGWTRDTPMPRDKASTQRWSKYEFADSNVIELELSPVGIVVAGSTAVAHYYYSQATENSEGKRETVHGRYTDILVRDGGEWRFVAWQGGEE
jgi:hypothetical protein